MIQAQDQIFADALIAQQLPADEQQQALFEAEGILACVSASVNDRKAAYAATAFEMARARSVRRVFAALVQAAVPFLVLKGAALAYLIYDQPWHRTRNDTDILIKPCDKARVFAVLHSLGYVKETTLPGALVMAESAFTTTDEFGLTLTFDVHWRLNNNWRLAALSTFEELSADRLQVPNMPTGTYTCNTIWAILIAAMHRCAHLNYPAYELNGFRRVEADFTLWTYDVHLLSLKLSPGDWQQMAQIAIERKFGHLLWAMLKRSEVLFKTPIPGDVMTMLLQAPDQLSADAFKGGLNAAWQSFKALPGCADKAAFIWQQLFPSRDYMRQQFGPDFLPLKYCSRLFSGFFHRIQ